MDAKPDGSARAPRRRSGGRPVPDAVRSAVGTTHVPGAVLALSSLTEIDYADEFTLTTDVQATPEQWARAMFGDVPDAAERFIWSRLLGIRLTRGRSPETVTGWRIAERGEHWVRLEASSWFLTGNLVVRATDGRLSLATSIRYDRGLGRLVWPPLSAVHRRLAPGLLRDAARARSAARPPRGPLIRVPGRAARCGASPCARCRSRRSSRA